MFTRKRLAKPRVSYAQRMVLMALLLSSVAMRLDAQNFPDRGFLPGESFDVSSTDDINLISGNMIYRVPIYKFPAGPGGQSATIDLIYNSFIYDPGTSYFPGTQGAIFPSTTGGRWRYSFEYSLIVDETGTRPTIVLPDGSRHTLFLKGAATDPSSLLYAYRSNDQGESEGYDGCGASTIDGKLVYSSADGTYMRLEMQTPAGSCTSSPARDGSGQPWTLYLRDGTRVSGVGLPGDADAITDRNGNTIRIGTSLACSVQNCQSFDALAFTVTDQLGRTFTRLANFDATRAGTDTLTAPGFSPSQTPIQLQWNVQWSDFQSTDQTYDDGDNTGTAFIPGGSFVQTITLPSVNGETLRYQFSYWTNPGWGEMKAATTPYGLTTTYGYVCENVDNDNSGCVSPVSRANQNPNAPIVSKIQSWTDSRGLARSQKWTYDAGIYGTPRTTVTVTAPDGGQTKHKFCGNTDPGYGKECETDLPNGDKITRTWQPVCARNSPLSGTMQLLASETRATAGGQTSSTSYTYDRNGNTISVQENSNAGWWRKTTNTFSFTGSTPVLSATQSSGSWIGNVCAQGSTTLTSENELDGSAWWNALSSEGGSLPGWTLTSLQSRDISDSTSDPIETWAYGYTGDNAFTTANVTSETNSATGIIIGHAYDQNGNLMSTTDGKQVVTTYISATHPTACSDGAGHSAYPSAIVRDSSGLSMTTLQTWDCTTGLLVSSVDPNNVATQYNYDAIGRKTSVNEAALRTSTISYVEGSLAPTNTPLVVTTTRNLDSGRNLVETQYFDALGKPALTQDPDTTSYGINATSFARVGVATDKLSYEVTSNPYRQTSDSTMGWTRTKYDTSGRVVGVDHFDASATPPCPFDRAMPFNDQTLTCAGAAQPTSSTTTTWTDYTALTIDESAISGNNASGIQRSSTYDSLGRLVSVQENPSGTPAGMTTTYTYDYGDRLRIVTQGGQQRNFTYDAIGRLATAVNPESGTTSYTYDGNGNMLTKTDGRGVVTNLSYDTLNRVTSRIYTIAAGTPTPIAGYTAGSPVTYCYDGSPAAAGCSQNPPAAYAKGRLTMTYNANSTSSLLAYDQLGRVLQSQQTAPGGAPFSFSYAYNFIDAIASETYPSGRVVTTSYDAAGRLSGVLDATPGTPGATYASGVGYAPNNAVNSLTLGNGIVESTTFNPRFQPYQITAGSILTLGLTWGTGTSSSSTTNDNGNVLSATIASPNGAFSQYFVYDPVNRLVTSVEYPTASPVPPSSAYNFVSPYTCPTSGVNWCETSSYDAYGNRLTGAAVVDVPTQINSSNNQNTNRDSSQHWAYDGAGNVISDGLGNQFSYDGENHQVAAGPSTYFYDGGGRRVAKTTAADGQTTYIYDAAGNLAAEYGSVPLIVTGTTFLTSDHLGSTRLVTSATNTLVNGTSPGPQGTPIECRDYLPFGEILATGRNSTCAGFEGRVTQLFTSKERDSETGLDYFGARYMSSAQGRFTSPDPSNIGVDFFLPQTWNRYAYVGNNPLAYVDQNGLWWTSSHNAAIAEALPGLSAADLKSVQNGSLAADKGQIMGMDAQSPAVSFAHDMSSGTDPDRASAVGTAVAAEGRFISDGQAAARREQAAWIASGYTGLSPKALQIFGNFTHPAVDATSPAHEGHQPWSGCGANLVACVWHGIGEAPILFNMNLGGRKESATSIIQFYFSDTFGSGASWATQKDPEADRQSSHHGCLIDRNTGGCAP
jgi:RHS repeat-associated protein